MLRVRRCFLLLPFVLLAIAASGCRSLGLPFAGRECREVGAPAVPASSPPPAHPDFERLLAFRNYYSIGDVTEYEHHFAVSFRCVEGVIEYLAISPSGAIRRTGGMWGPLPMKDGEPAPIPAEQLDNKRAILARHAAAYDGESGVKIWYLGSYREVHVTELVPESAPGDPYRRMVTQATVVLRAGPDLTTVSGIAEMSSLGETRLCWRDIHVRDCTEQAWVDFTPTTIGAAQLPSLVSAASPVAAEERARFQAAVLEAARRRAAGQPTASLDEIVARQGDTLLPPGLSRSFQVEFKLYARPTDPARPQQTEDSSLVSSLPVRDAMAGTARSVVRGKIAGIGVVAEIEMAPDGPRDPAERGELQVPFRVRYRLTDDRGHKRSGEVVITATVLVDGEAAAAHSRVYQGKVMERVHEPPIGQTFPGLGSFRQIDAYFDVSAFAPVPTSWP